MSSLKIRDHVMKTSTQIFSSLCRLRPKEERSDGNDGKQTGLWYRPVGLCIYIFGTGHTVNYSIANFGLDSPKTKFDHLETIEDRG